MATRRLTRAEKQEQTREAILRSAAALFATQGVEGTSLEEIAQHAGRTQGAIYSNFKNKADLWWAICEQTSQTLEFADFFRGDRPFREELRDAGAAGARLLRELSRTDLLLDQEFNLFLMRHPRARARALREIREADREGAETLERAAEKRGEAMPMSSERMGLLMAVIARGLIHFYMLDPESIDEEFCADAFALLAGCEDPKRRRSS